MPIALTHLPSPALADCQLTYLPPRPIDAAAAGRQHRAYRHMLESCGAEVLALAATGVVADHHQRSPIGGQGLLEHETVSRSRLSVGSSRTRKPGGSTSVAGTTDFLTYEVPAEALFPTAWWSISS